MLIVIQISGLDPNAEAFLPNLNDRFTTMQITFGTGLGNGARAQVNRQVQLAGNGIANARNDYIPSSVRDENFNLNRVAPHSENSLFPQASRVHQIVANENFPQPRRTVPVHQWKLSFSGDSKGLHLYDFLSQIELYKCSERVSNAELLAAIVHLLNGPARMWYQSMHGVFRSWEELVAALKNAFLPPNYNYIFLSDISNRFQRPN